MHTCTTESVIQGSPHIPTWLDKRWCQAGLAQQVLSDGLHRVYHARIMEGTREARSSLAVMLRQLLAQRGDEAGEGGLGFISKAHGRACHPQPRTRPAKRATAERIAASGEVSGGVTDLS